MSENRCVCCGAVIPEGRQVCKRCEAMAEHKTADEMFRELGYYRDYPTESNKTVRYQKKFGSHIVWYTDTGEVEKENDSFHEQSWSVEEILACAQLIREMGCIDE